MNKSKIDLNTVLGLLLIGGIFLYFGYFSQPDPVEQTATETADTAEVAEETEDFVEHRESEADAVADTLSEVPTQGDEEVFTIENDVLEIHVSTRGGQIVQARLKDYDTYDSLPLYLINENAEFNLKLQGEREYNTADLFFTATQQSDQKLRMSLNLGEGRTLEYEYSLQPADYMLNWDVSSSGMGDMFNRETGLQWEMKTFQLEKSKENEDMYTHGMYLHSGDDIDELSTTGQDSEEAGNLKWVAFKQQFFSSILLNKHGDFPQAAMASQTLEGEEGYIKHFAAKVKLNEGSTDLDLPMGLYLGPNKYEILKTYDLEFEELIPLGWGILGWINRGVVLPIFNWLEDYGLNYGIIILIMALLIKIALFPLTYQSYRSMAKMRVLKPEMDELNEKYKEKDPMKKQQATMELYRKAGVNPLGGCIPVLFQMPILIALFKFFPASIELRQQSFLWAEDLSTYDSIAQLPFHIPFYGDHVSLFTLLMTVSTLMYTYMNNQLSGTNQQYPQMKYIMYFMPIIFLGVFNGYAAGLSYYYFVANVITFGQQFIIRATLDDEKIHAKIQAKKEQPKKENRFMRRMREMQEEQNRQARRKKK